MCSSSGRPSSSLCLHQIWRNVALHQCLLCSEWVPSEWESDKHITIIHTTPVHQLTSKINELIKTLLSKIWINEFTPKMRGQRWLFHWEEAYYGLRTRILVRNRNTSASHLTSLHGNFDLFLWNDPPHAQCLVSHCRQL